MYAGGPHHRQQPPYGKARPSPSPPKKRRSEQTTDHLLLEPPLLPFVVKIPFPDRKLPVCENCKTCYRTREVCRGRDKHTDLPWKTIHICIQLDESCIGEDGKLIGGMDTEFTAEYLWEHSYFMFRHQVKTEVPICHACKAKNYTRNYCRERLYHKNLPWDTTYVLLKRKIRTENEGDEDEEVKSSRGPRPKQEMTRKEQEESSPVQEKQMVTSKNQLLELQERPNDERRSEECSSSSAVVAPIILNKNKEIHHHKDSIAEPPKFSSTPLKGGSRETPGPSLSRRNLARQEKKNQSGYTESSSVPSAVDKKEDAGEPGHHDKAHHFMASSISSSTTSPGKGKKVPNPLEVGVDHEEKESKEHVDLACERIAAHREAQISQSVVLRDDNSKRQTSEKDDEVSSETERKVASTSPDEHDSLIASPGGVSYNVKRSNDDDFFTSIIPTSRAFIVTVNGTKKESNYEWLDIDTETKDVILQRKKNSTTGGTKVLNALHHQNYSSMSQRPPPASYLAPRPGHPDIVGFPYHHPENYGYGPYGDPSLVAMTAAYHQHHQYLPYGSYHSLYDPGLMQQPPPVGGNDYLGGNDYNQQAPPQRYGLHNRPSSPSYPSEEHDPGNVLPSQTYPGSGHDTNQPSPRPPTSRDEHGIHINRASPFEENQQKQSSSSPSGDRPSMPPEERGGHIGAKKPSYSRSFSSTSNPRPLHGDPRYRANEPSNESRDYNSSISQHSGGTPRNQDFPILSPQPHHTSSSGRGPQAERRSAIDSSSTIAPQEPQQAYHGPPAWWYYNPHLARTGGGSFVMGVSQPPPPPAENSEASILNSRSQVRGRDPSPQQDMRGMYHNIMLQQQQSGGESKGQKATAGHHHQSSPAPRRGIEVSSTLDEMILPSPPLPSIANLPGRRNTEDPASPQEYERGRVPSTPTPIAPRTRSSDQMYNYKNRSPPSPQE